jgi:hypothetical protein
MKNSNDTIGNQTRYLPACSAVPQPTAPPRVPIYQLNFTVFMYVTQISHCIWHSVLSAVSHNRGRCSNVLPVDTGALPYDVCCIFLPVCLTDIVDRAMCKHYNKSFESSLNPHLQVFLNYMSKFEYLNCNFHYILAHQA